MNIEKSKWWLPVLTLSVVGSLFGCAYCLALIATLVSVSFADNLCGFAKSAT